MKHQQPLDFCTGTPLWPWARVLFESLRHGVRCKGNKRGGAWFPWLRRLFGRQTEGSKGQSLVVVCTQRSFLQRSFFLWFPGWAHTTLLCVVVVIIDAGIVVCILYLLNSVKECVKARTLRCLRCPPSFKKNQSPGHRVWWQVLARESSFRISKSWRVGFDSTVTAT